MLHQTLKRCSQRTHNFIEPLTSLETYLGLCQTSLMEGFCENKQQQKAFIYFHKHSPSQMFGEPSIRLCKQGCFTLNLLAASKQILYFFRIEDADSIYLFVFFLKKRSFSILSFPLSPLLYLFDFFSIACSISGTFKYST